MAKKKSTGASQHRRPAGKRLGLKVSSGEKVSKGNVLVRQHGTNVKPGKNVKAGRDYTLYSVVEGVVKVSKKLGRKVISIENLKLKISPRPKTDKK